MKWVLTEPRGVSEALQGRAANAKLFMPSYLKRFKEPRPGCLSALEFTDEFNINQRLDVYAEGYYSRIHDCLADDFKLIKSVLSEDEFRELVSDYLVEHPSKFTSVGEVGRFLAEFLKKSQYLKNKYSFLSALALLEWSLIECFYSPNESPISLSDAMTLGSEELTNSNFSISAGNRIITVKYPVHLIWDDGEWQENIHASQMKSGQYFYCISKTAQYRLNVLPCTLFAVEVLKALKFGKTLGESIETAIPLLTDESELQSFMTLFADWTSSGVFSEISC